MVVPGNVLTGRNKGGHALLRDGAKIVESADDIVRELGWCCEPDATTGNEITRCREAVSGDPLIQQMAAGQPYDVDELTASQGWNRSAYCLAYSISSCEVLCAAPAEVVSCGRYERVSVIDKRRIETSKKWQQESLWLSSSRPPRRRLWSASSGTNTGSRRATVIFGSPRVGCGRAEGDQGKGVGTTRCRCRAGLHAVLRRPERQAKAGRAPQDSRQRGVRAAARNRPRSRRRVDQLAPDTGPQTQSPRPSIVFHEITEDAVKEALDNPGDVNENLVRAQESRRILDRLYGYTLSPVLWKKVQTGLSAGRVQSVAVRLIVEREEERRAFHSASTGTSKRP